MCGRGGWNGWGFRGCGMGRGSRGWPGTERLRGKGVF